MTTRSKLESLGKNLEESIGARPVQDSRRLSPAAAAKDIGRRPLRDVGRIDIGQVIADPSQPRTEFDDEAIRRLANSIKRKGQLAPIRVRWSSNHEKWIVVCGERRLRAVQFAGLPTIDCVFDERKLSASEILEQQMIENLLREDLSPIEKARGFQALMNVNGWNRKEVADSLHLPPSTVTRSLALLELPDAIQQQVESGRIAARSAYEISKVDDAAEQKLLAEDAANGMTLNETKDAVRKPKRRRANKRKRLEFRTENGWVIHATPPTKTRRTYADLRISMQEALEEIELRNRNNIRID